jgi:radical SAM superfamily enzyme YgiQ (UPF0313 family)
MSEQLDLLLVNVGGTKKRVYQELSKDYSAIEPPFWAALTAGFIRKKGFNVKILDANAENLDISETTQEIEKLNPSLTCIVVYGQNPQASTTLMWAVSQLCKEIKKINSNRKLILEGLHPSALPKRTLSEEECDFVCEGEGFYTLLGLLEKKDFKEIRGLWYKQDGEIFNTLRAELIKDLTSELSDVAWDLLPMAKYKAHNWHCLGDLDSRNRYTSISTSLGCPFNCSFCCINAPFEKHLWRTWTPEWVLNQIDILVKKYNVKNIKFIDELFVFNPEHFVPIAEGLIARNYNLNIWAYARIDTINEKYLELFKKAGINWLALGIESGSEEVRKDVSKGCFEQENISEVVRKIKKAGINVGGNYMFGLPGDTLESMKKTLDLAMELNCEWANFNCAMAYPGSRLYTEYKNKEKLPDGLNGPGWIGYSQYAYEILPLSTENLSAKEILKFRDDAFYTYFTNPIYLTMIEAKFGKEARKHLEEMTKTRLKRKLLGDEKGIKVFNDETLLEIFKKMSYTRNFEREVIKAVNNNKIKTPVYLSIGQETVSSTISSFFKPDYILTQHRGHSVYLAFGGNSEKLADELLGKESGCCKGKGGSPGIQDDNIGMIGHHGLIGENVPLAVGVALGAPDKKTLCVFGDGAAEEDYVFTSMAFAKTHKLPILFICEDNNLCILTKKADRRDWELEGALKGIGMPSADISDNPEEIAFYIEKFKDNLPAFINVRTCRHNWHVGVGTDGIPEQDRLQIIKEELFMKGYSKELENIEKDTKEECEKLWQERLQKQ